MGLLDNGDDLLSLGMGLLAAGGPSRTPVNFGQALAAGYGQMREGQKSRQAMEMQAQQMEMQKMQMQQAQMQLEELKRARDQKLQIESLAKNSVLTPEMQAIGAGGPTPQAAALIPSLKTKFDIDGFLTSMMGVDPLKAYEMKKAMVKDPIKLGAEETLIDPNTLKPIVTGKGKNELKEGYLVPDGAGGWKVDPTLFAAQKELKATGAQRSTTNVFNNTKDDFKNERDLRNDFAGLPTTKAFNEVQSAYDQIQVALQKASPAGDLAAATKIMKILDPGSVVRESELGMAMAATGMLDRVENYASMVAKGTKLTPQQRVDFGQLATQLYDVAGERYNKSADEYRGVASQYNLKADRVAKKAIPATKAQPLPSNPTASTLIKGVVYDTPRGAAKWDGMQFIKE